LPEWINEERAPSHFKCPITLCVMREPAVTPAGITYERSALMQWLDHQHVEPSTKRRLKRSHVVPNLTLRAMIEDWLQHERDVRSGKSGGGGGVDGSSGGRIDNHGGLPPGAAAVLQADRDALRAVRQRMYAALKERAAMGVCYEEQRWEAYRENRNREEETGRSIPRVRTSRVSRRIRPAGSRVRVPRRPSVSACFKARASRGRTAPGWRRCLAPSSPRSRRINPPVKS